MSRLRLYMDERGRLTMHAAGFSWAAAVVPLLWALHRRQYRLALVFFVVNKGIEITILESGLGPSWFLAPYLLQFPVLGFYANRLHAWLLEREGWRITAEESAPTIKPQP